jgi:hypothetical protein
MYQSVINTMLIMLPSDAPLPLHNAKSAQLYKNKKIPLGRALCEHNFKVQKEKRDYEIKRVIQERKKLREIKNESCEKENKDNLVDEECVDLNKRLSFDDLDIEWGDNMSGKEDKADSSSDSDRLMVDYEDSEDEFKPPVAKKKNRLSARKRRSKKRKNSSNASLDMDTTAPSPTPTPSTTPSKDAKEEEVTITHSKKLGQRRTKTERHPDDEKEHQRTHHRVLKHTNQYDGVHALTWGITIILLTNATCNMLVWNDCRYAFEHTP